MARPIDAQVREETKDTLANILEFDVRYKVARFADRAMLDDFRSFEELLHVNYPIRAIGLRLARDDLGRPLDLPDTPIAPSSVTQDFARYPYAATASAYLFTVMEAYGERVAVILHGAGATHSTGSWHSGVTSGLSLTDRQQVKAQAARLASALGVAAVDVEENVLAKLAHLKSARNDVVHRGSGWVDYDRFLDGVISVVAHLHFLAVQTDARIVVYPWEIYEDEWPDRW